MTSSQIPSRIAMPCPFGGFGSDNITPIKTVTGTDVNFPDGFPSAYGAPTDTDGKFVTRKEMNAIGNLASNDLFYHKCGGLNTFDADFCAAVGGYPYGAVLDYIVGTERHSVISLKDNNKVDFTGKILSESQISAGITTGTIDGENWRYLNQDRPSFNLFSDDNITTSSGFTTIGTIVANRSGTISVNFDYDCKRNEETGLITSTSMGNVVKYPALQPAVMLLEVTDNTLIIYPTAVYGTSGVTWTGNSWFIASGALIADGGAVSSTTVVTGNIAYRSTMPHVVSGKSYIIGLATPYDTFVTHTTNKVDLTYYRMTMRSSVTINIV